MGERRIQGDHPNAALTLLDTGTRTDTLAVELTARPRHDRRRRSMRYVVRRLSRPPGTPDRRIPRRFGNAALFIDAADDAQFSHAPPAIRQTEAFMAAAS